MLGTVSRRIAYTGDGATDTFAVPFQFFEIDVYVDGVLQTLITDYTITQAAPGETGSVVFEEAPENDTDVVIVGKTVGSQGVDLGNNLEFDADSIEKQLDRLAAAVQDVSAGLERSLRLLDFDDAVDMRLPSKEDRASKMLAFDEFGVPILLQINQEGGPVPVFDDVNIASGGAIIFANGDVEIAHLTNALSFIGALNGYSFDGRVSVDVGISPLPDQAVWDAARAARFGSNLPEDGTGVAGSANENAHTVQALIPSTSSAASYQKSAGLYFAFTQDPSTALILRDAVGLDRRGIIASTNTLGRAWGGTDWAQIQAGGVGDGLLVGNEIDIDNNGSNQAAVDTTTSKYGLVVVSIGTQPVTAGIFFFHLTDGFHYFVYANQDDIEAGGHFLMLNGFFDVDRAGNIMTAGGLRVGFTGTPTSDDRVEIGDANFYLDHSSGTTLITFDANDALSYDRSQNQWVFATGGNAGPVIRNNVIFPAANDGVALGVSGAAFSDLFLASGGVIDFNNSDVLLTHAANLLTLSGGNFNLASGQVLQVNGTQVVSSRVTGYTAFTGTNTNRATAYDTATITLVQLAERVRALQIDLTAHGLIGA